MVCPVRRSEDQAVQTGAFRVGPVFRVGHAKSRRGAHHVFVFFFAAIMQQPKNGLPVRIQMRPD